MNSFNKLKEITQLLNENIIDDTITKLQEEISHFEQQHENNPGVMTLLKMMRSLSRYLGSKKHTAHADAIPTLNSITQCLEMLIQNPDLKKGEVNQALLNEIERYKTLQNKIASKPSISQNDITDLKAVILAIDWEISSTTLQNFETVTKALLSQLKSYKIHYIYLKIIYSTGRYIGRQKENAPTNSISFLRSVYENFEQIVLTPDLTFKEKKQFIQTDINRFYEFKQNITQKNIKPPTEDDTTEDSTSEDESLSPALSHIKQTDRPAADDIVPLTALDESKNLSTEKKINPAAKTPALTEKGKLSTGPRDIMDDLFSVKESPADELLDAIHLQDVPGHNQVQAMNMLDQTRSVPTDGIKNLTPQRMDNEPIPEIESRLDEFFNLDEPGDSPVIDNNELDNDTYSDRVENDSLENGIVPFHPEDESFEDTSDINDTNDDPDSISQETDFDILRRLNTAFDTSENLEDESSWLSIHQDLSLLEKKWQNHPEKTYLLLIISSLINRLKNPVQTIQQKEKNEDKDETDKNILETSQEEPNGFLGKIKGMFTP